ncbi:MAG: carbohydrate-binding domain-containing protein [Oscillospiraceae bacterium]|nr:carbohydrate-binding domain-containing protein [Oscillospiraceae bacterium]MBR2366615.1 carbohydrate-binding domain-containing protein [Oscillospiraceae bacterium]
MKTTMKSMSRILAQLLIVAMLLSAIPFVASAAELPQSQATFTFSDQAIVGEGAVLSNEISGTTLTIKQSGVYTLTGACAEGNVIVAKGVTGVTLFFNDLKLVSAKGAPVSIEANAEATIYLLGTNALNNIAVRPAKEKAAAVPAEGAAATVNAEQAAKKQKAPAFVGAAIKVKSGATLKITGEGVLFLNSTVRSAISCAKNAKVTLKGNSLNFDRKKVQKVKEAQPTEVPAAAPAETPAPEAAIVPEAPAEGEGAPATVNAAKKKNVKKNAAKKNNAKKTVKIKPLEIKAGEVISVKDANGNVVLSAVAPIDARQVIFVSEKLTAKQSYTLYAGETQVSKATARAAQRLNAPVNNKKNNKKNNKNNKNAQKWNNKNVKRGVGRKNVGKQAKPAAIPA